MVAPTLEVLDLSECRLGRTSHAAGPFESAVLPVVAGMESLVGLNLKGNALGNSGWRPLGLALQRGELPNLRSLNINQNEMTDGAAPLLAGALREHGSLATLRLGGNMVGDDGMKAVLTAAQKARALKRFEAQYDSGLGDATCDALVDLIRAKAPPPALVALDLRGNVALEGCSEAVAKALLDTRKSRKPAVEELWFPINDQQEGSGAVDLVQQLEYAEVMGHDEL